MVITNNMIDELAHLSMLEFSADEKAALKTDMEKMIGFIEKLNEIDTSGVEPLLYVTSNLNELREDVIEGSTTREEALKNAPINNDTYFTVPKVIRK